MSPADMLAATSQDIEDWLGSFTSPRTRHAYRSDIKCFVHWARRRQIVSHDPTEMTDQIKLPKSLPKPIRQELIPGLIASAHNRHVRYAIALAAYAGLRRAEITALDAADVSLQREHPILVVRAGKGGKDRVIPVHPQLAPLLAEQTFGRYVPVEPDTLSTAVTRHLHAQGVPATMHCLRHTFGTEVARVSGSLILTGTLMGHQSPVTTQQYVGWMGGDATDAIAKMYAGQP
jgi:integrase